VFFTGHAPSTWHSCDIIPFLHACENGFLLSHGSVRSMILAILRLFVDDSVSTNGDGVFQYATSRDNVVYGYAISAISCGVWFGLSQFYTWTGTIIETYFNHVTCDRAWRPHMTWPVTTHAVRRAVDLGAYASMMTHDASCKNDARTHFFSTDQHVNAIMTWCAMFWRLLTQSSLSSFVISRLSITNRWTFQFLHVMQLHSKIGKCQSRTLFTAPLFFLT